MEEFKAIKVSMNEKGVNGDFEKLLRRFKRKVIREAVLYELRERQSYKKPSKKKHHRDYVRRCKIKYGDRRTEKDEKK